MEDKQVIKELINKYPFLLPRNVWTGEEIEDYDYSWCLFKNEIPNGWWERWGLIYLDDLKGVLEKYNAVDAFRFSQVKEKFGGLRAYNFGQPEEWDSHEHAWEYISKHTCVKCGKFPSIMRYSGWISPWCEECFKSQESVINNYDYDDEDRLTVDKDNRLHEYLVINHYTKDGDYRYWIDMKPYYNKIGWKYTNDDLVLKEEIEKIVEERDGKKSNKE